MANDNYIDNRGYGEWEITTYNPTREFGPYTGWMTVGKDFHVIYKNYEGSVFSICLASFPSPNVAAAENKAECTGK